MGSAPPTSIAIPPEFQSQLTVVSPLDDRSDSDILASLEHFQPVTSEKNIWAFWHSGVQGLPAWSKRNVVDWFRINGPSWTIRVLDSDQSSPNYFLNYVDGHGKTEMFPASVAERRMTGSFTAQHTADFVRSAVIYLHGGVFMDVGCLLIRRLDRVCWDKLEDDASPYRVAVPSMDNASMANHFVACRKGDPFIKCWHQLMLHLWQGKTESSGTVIGNPLMEFIPRRGPGVGEAIAALGWDFTDMPSALEYVLQILAWDRLCLLDKEDSEGFNSARYWTEHILAWDSLSEHWAAEVMMHEKGPHPKIMRLLATRRDADPEPSDYTEAYELTWRLLTSSSMQKVTSARGLTDTPHLGVLWELPENTGKDCAESTFAELLRYGSVHFEQTRKEIRYIQNRPVEDPLKKDLLEP